MRAKLAAMVMSAVGVSSIQAASIQWDNGAIDSEWNSALNWSTDSLPAGGNNAILAGADYTTVNSVVSAGPANIIIRTGAVLEIAADMTNLSNITLGNNGASGPTILQSNADVTASGYVRLGQSARTPAVYDITGDSELNVAGAFTVYKDGFLSLAGGNTSVTAASLEVQDSGTVRFEGDITGVSEIDVSGSFTVGTAAQLVIDLSYYNSGGGIYELVRFGSQSGDFAEENVSIEGLKEGWSASVAFDSDSFSLTIVPKADSRAKLWFVAAANAGDADAVAEDLILNTGHGFATLDAAGLSCTKVVDGNDLVYSITWSGSDYDGDQVNDTLSYDVRVEAFANSAYVYIAEQGASSVTLGTESTVTDINGNWGVGVDFDIDKGESLRFSVENVSVSAEGFSAVFEGVSSMDVIETNAGHSHAHIRGTGEGLNSGSFSSATASFSFPAEETLVVTGAGSNVTREWAIFGLAFEFTVSDTFGPYTPEIGDYSDDPTGPGYLDPYSVQTDFTNYPDFSWDSVPRWLAVRDNNGYTTAAIESIANNYQIVMLEKSNQNGQGNTEAGAIKAASDLKAINPNIKALYYWNTVVYYGGYEANGTYNSDDWSRYTENEDGTRTYELIRGIYRKFNPSVPELREWWINSALNVLNDPVGSTVIDGIFLDKVSGGGKPLIDEDGEYVSDYVNMVHSLWEQMPADKLLTGNTLRNENTNGDRSMMEIMEGSYLERWKLPFKGSNPEQSTADAICMTIQLMREALARGKIIMLQSGPIGFTEVDDDSGALFDNADAFAEAVDFPLGVFLICAAENAYFSYQNGVNANDDTWKWDSSSVDVLSRPLGAPLGDPLKEGYVYTRSYEHADVWVDVENIRSVVLWKNNIGSPALLGSGSSVTDTSYTLEAGGKVSGNSDQFLYLSQPHLSDGEIILQVHSVENTNLWAKGGVMFRENLDADSKFVYLFVRPNGTIRMSTRQTPGAGVKAIAGISMGGTSSKWIKLVREGDLFTGYASLDKENWTLVNTTTLTMDVFPEAGIAVTSQNLEELTTVEAADFSIETISE